MNNGRKQCLGLPGGQGGGGASTAGEDIRMHSTNDSAGNGGAGKVCDITGTDTYCAGGGGGGIRPSNGEFPNIDSRMIFVGALAVKAVVVQVAVARAGSQSAHGENGVDGTGGGGGGVGSVSLWWRLWSGQRIQTGRKRVDPAW